MDEKSKADLLKRSQASPINILIRKLRGVKDPKKPRVPVKTNWWRKGDGHTRRPNWRKDPHDM